MEPAERNGACVRSAIILAGGDGVRLRPLTVKIAGFAAPKQFCPILGETTLLEQTRQRVAHVVAPANTSVVVTEHHERFYSPALAGLSAENLVVQPEDRGTGAAILYATLRAAAAAPHNSVAIFPSDHFVDDDRGFMAHVQAAFDVVEEFPDRMVVLGIAPDAPEVGYGWVKPEGRLPSRRAAVFGVRSFVEKPAFQVAKELMAHGGLWNSFVLVAKIQNLLGLIGAAAPQLFAALAALRPVLGTALEAGGVRQAYQDLSGVNFSHEVLSRYPDRLAVLPVQGVSWTDLGEPGRVFEVWKRFGLQPNGLAA